MAPSFRLSIDVGGTFTDLVALDEATGIVALEKVLTTPHDPSIGASQGARELLGRLGWSPAELRNVIHATTLASNAIIERKGAKTGLITTKGFRDILQIGSELRYHIHDLFMRRPEPLAPRELRLEVDERLRHDGSVIRPLAMEDARRAARTLREAGVEAVAVCLLHSYANDAHERLVADALRAEHPAAEVSLSSAVCPEVREFARTSTTVANAYVQPLIRRYLGTLRDSLTGLEIGGDLYLMLSNGGIAPVEAARAAPIRLVESGPAAGAMAAVAYGRLTGQPDIISLDMGGTTAKICLIDQGQPTRTNDGEVARVSRFRKGSGIALREPMINLLEIGAGGGSIARADTMGLLRVGPDSAGADPGPACYGRGGAQPTVTDADLVLGYLDPAYFLGGAMQLDDEAARRAIADKIGRPLGLSLERAAAGVRAIVDNSMATALRIHVAERGRDPRGYAVIAFGGAGPGHAYELARLLGIRTLIVPLGAGTTSALGCLVAPPMFDSVRTFVGRLESLDWQRANRLLDEMERDGRARLAGMGIGGDVVVERIAEMRYLRQGYEIPVPLPPGRLGAASFAEIRDAFYEVYARLFARHLTHVGVEAVNWRVTVSGPAPVAVPRYAPELVGSPHKGRRRIFFDRAGGFVDTDVYDRYALKVGDAFGGPAVVEEREATTVIGPRAQVRVDELLNLVVTLPEG